MPFDWREFLFLAHELRKDPRENVRRTCLGRAYYYVYNLGLAQARRMQWPEPRHSLHKALWDWYQKHHDVSIRQLGVYGSSMYSLRIDADYRDSPLLDRHAVERQLGRALNFETLVAQRNGQSPPTPLVP